MQNFVRIAQQLSNLFWLGRLNEEAVAAAGLAGPVIGFMITLIVLGPFVGTETLVSQRVGNEDYSGAESALFTGIVALLLLGAIISLITYFGASSLIGFLSSFQHTPSADNVPSLSVAYLKITAFGFTFAAISDGLEAGFIGWGDSKSSLYSNIASVVVDILLAPVFIFGIGPVPSLGIAGAALSTVAGYLGGLILALIIMYGGWSEAKLTRTNIEWKIEEYKELLEVGLPITGQAVASQSVSIFLTFLTFTVGGVAGIAAYSVGTRVSSLTLLPAKGFKQATQSVVGQNLGANQPKRANKSVILSGGIIFSVLFVLGLIQWLIPTSVVDLLVPSLNNESRELAASFVRILSYSYPAVGVLYIIRAGFDAARKTRVTFWSSVLENYGIQLPITGIGLVFGFGVLSIFWAESLSRIIVASAIVLYYYYHSKNGVMVKSAKHVNVSSSDD
ncbi:MATE family efflux transporter [Halorussus salilacus]|uniref:MATE family efflux transporter n=1 Tax=Halorussus salilacus TaxID=2953750 RepID=UPI003F642D83